MKQENNIEEYLLFDEYVCLDDAMIQLVTSLIQDKPNQIEQAKAIFEYVRDNIKHSADYQLNQVSIRACDVLNNGHGICYAKSNLLAAMMRYAKIPTGFCYQRLTVANDDSEGYCLHTLNAVYVNNRWILLDARGNKKGVNAQFSLDKPKLAFLLKEQYDEKLYPTIYSKPLKCTMEILEKSTSLKYLISHLPTEI